MKADPCDRVYRGGAWILRDPRWLHPAYRESWNEPTFSDPLLGFRVFRHYREVMP